MTIRDITAAIKAKYLPVFVSRIDDELAEFRDLEKTVKADSERFTSGPSAAIAALTKDIGE